MTRIGFKATFDRFIEDTKALEQAILTAKKHPFGSNVELFETGDYQVSFNTENGPFCINEGFVMLVEQLTALGYDTEPEACLKNVIQELKDEYESDIVEWDAVDRDWRVDDVKTFIQELKDYCNADIVEWDAVKRQGRVEDVKSCIQELKDDYESDMLEWDAVERDWRVDDVNIFLQKLKDYCEENAWFNTP